MHLVFVKILFLLCFYHSCKGLGLYEESAEDVLTKNETVENPLMELFQEQPVAVVIELRETLLEKFKSLLRKENEDSFPIQRTTIVTFDYTGLRDVSFHNDTSDVRQALMDLRPTDNGRETYSPTIRVLWELLQMDIPEGVILLVTMSEPEDELFADNLWRSLMGKRCQLSLIWAGNYPSGEYLLLKDMALRSGGTFEYLTSDNNSEENAAEEFYPKPEFENIAEQIKFPDDQNDTTAEIPLVSRTADQKALPKAVVPLIIEVASGTRLEVTPGIPTQIKFTVKNNLNEPLHVIFSARFNGIIQSLQPPRELIPPLGTITVIVNLFGQNVIQSVNAVGTLTLAARFSDKVISRSALISMTPETITDYTAPKMTYKYIGDCTNYKEPQNCEFGQWNLEATLHDEDSGLLKVLSEPYGLLFQTEFISGTKTPVTVLYTATCCQPNVIIWAEDLKGNYVKKSFDVFNQGLLAGEIAGIVLGVLLILFIIAAVIVAIVLIKRRNQRNMIIPRARSGSR